MCEFGGVKFTSATGDVYVCNGAPGAKGEQGPQGVEGAIGLQGLPGEQGPQGVAGPQGVKGDTGETGPQGIQGAKGDVGAQGPQGAKGDTGAQGLQGLQGAKGDTGAQGLQGIQGAKGDTGAQGLQGIQGAKGDTGAQGLQGIQGAKGDTGAQGVAGVNGTSVTGQTVAAGDPTCTYGGVRYTSATGVDSVCNGAPGAQGPQGDKGDLGPPGVQGPPGPVTTYSATSPITLNGTTFGLAACAPSQIYKMRSDGSGWDCGADDGATSATAPLKITGGSKVEIDTTGCRPGDTLRFDGTSFSCNPSVSRSTAVYRWNTFSTYLQTAGWAIGNDAALFGGVNPSNWTDGNFRAGHISADKEVQRTLFTRKGYGGKNAMVMVNREQIYWSSTDGRVVVALFRVRNATANAIPWTPQFYYSSYGSWNEWAGAALNGSEVWNSGGGNAYWSTATVTLSLPPGRTSTFIVNATSGPPWNNYGNMGERFTVLAFYNNSLALPAGLEYVDDLDTATGGWDQ